MNELRSRISAAAMALLAVAVVVVHVIDQGGLVGDKAPTYVGVGYWLLELGGLAAVALLLLRRRDGLLLALAVGAGPVVGYVLSRGPGLPGYVDDRGNWGEPLGLISLAVELALVGSALAALRTGAPAPAFETASGPVEIAARRAA